MNIAIIKTISKLLVLLILFVVLFLISAFLYSARYWPDLYNYLTPNITIKHIHSISELNYTVLQIDFATENYTNTEWYDTSTTEEYVLDNFGNDSGIFDEEFDYYVILKNASRSKRNINETSVNEDDDLLSNETIEVDYFFDYNGAVSEGIKEKTEANEEIELYGELPTKSIDINILHELDLKEIKAVG